MANTQMAQLGWVYAYNNALIMIDPLIVQFRYMISNSVKITELKVVGVVRKVSYNGFGREYQVSYFVAGESKLEWFFEDQLN